MADKGVAKSFLETKWFGLLIGLAVFALIAALTYGTRLISNLETKILDFNFRMKNPKVTTRIQEGVTAEEVNPKISPDIRIVAIDEKSLARFGRWPFPRYRHADLVNTFARIKDPAERERALFLDIFFNEPDEKSPQDDAVLVGAIRANGRVFLETVLQRGEFPETGGEGPFERQKALADRFGTITRITGRASFLQNVFRKVRTLAPKPALPPWTKVESFYGIKPPLEPYARATHGYGHANFVQDEDQVYRRASLVVRASQEVESIPLDKLSVGTPVDTVSFERLSWRDGYGVEHDVPVPLTDKGIAELREEMRGSPIQRFKDGAAPVELINFPLSELTVELSETFGRSDHLYWQDHRGRFRSIPVPLTEKSLAKLQTRIVRDARRVIRNAEIDAAGGKITWAWAQLASFFRTIMGEAADASGEVSEEGTAEQATPEDLAASWPIQRDTFAVKKYRETWIPSVTMALAAEYLNVKISDVEVVLGKHVRIPSPQYFNVETKSWQPYTVVARPAKRDKAGNEVRPEQRKVLTEILIPIDEHGQMLINFMGYPSSATFGEPSTYTVHSYSRYAASPPGSDPATWDDTRGMANKLVMLGAFSQGMAEDQKPTPYGLMFGVEIHANALNTILMGNFIRYAPLWLSLLILFGMVMLTAFMTGRLSTVWSLLGLVVVLAAYFILVLVVFDNSAFVLTLSAPLFGAFLCSLAVIAYRTVFEERDKRRNKAIFSKMVGPALLEQILEHPPELGGVDKTLTVFFSDIRGFSSISERMSSQLLVNYLNRYLTAMTDIVKDYNGTLDKYIGDAVMAFWGAPVDQPDHALLACKCALQQMKTLEDLNMAWRAEEQQTMDIGIGISTGPMTVAYMGSSEHLSYTVIGDAVNLGSRLEGANKEYYSPGHGAGHYSRILISELTYEDVKDKVIARELDVVRVKGKQKPTVIYELIDVIGGYAPPKPPKVKGKILAAEAAADRRERAAKARAKGR